MYKVIVTYKERIAYLMISHFSIKESSGATVAQQDQSVSDIQ